MPPPHILVVDDNPLFLELVVHFLVSELRVEVVYRANSGDAALDLLCDKRPDLVLMDVSMPGMNGLDTTRRIKGRPEAPLVIILTLHDGPEYIAAAKDARADAFVCKSELDTQLIPAIEQLFIEHALKDSSGAEHADSL